MGDKVRLRMAISNQAASVARKTYQLEYSTASCTSWTKVPRSVDTSTEAWRLEPSSNISDNQTTTHSTGITTPSGKTFAPGRLQTASSATYPVRLASSEYTELEYSLRSTGSVTPYTPYCFRVTNVGDSSDFTYSITPQITVIPAEYRRQSGGGGGGGAVFAAPSSEEPVSAATSSATGGTVSGQEAATTTESVAAPATQQSTTTPTRRQGGGGDVGLLNTGNTFAQAGTQGMVLGATATCVNLPYNMHRGAENGQVKKLQAYLISLSFLKGEVTGFYGDSTVKAVNAYQYDRNLKRTGMVYEMTRERIKKETCGE
jgi:hypothetical protein